MKVLFKSGFNNTKTKKKHIQSKKLLELLTNSDCRFHRTKHLFRMNLFCNIFSLGLRQELSVVI